MFLLVYSRHVSAPRKGTKRWLFHGKLMMLLFILRLQVWIMYYRFLNKSDSCFNNTGGRPQMANIKGVQSLYCSGLDLEIPLVSSLSPCSNAYKYKVDRCISDFAAAFIDINETQESLCRYDV